ncbi:acetyl-CoA hydrolase/transferase C-terminal domain-containing protein [Wenxinia saemankumensis]|nr:acetyl-CoA hydrolase/transferase C-terminal domain-containing protein [Wenxinia saemankumensis]
MTDPDAAAHEAVRLTGGEIRLALPLGLGKPVRFVNALVRLARDDPSIRLDIFTALTLEVPDPADDMERRFLGPARDRLFGAYPDLLYARMLRDGTLPANVTVSEFFFMAGNWLRHEGAQQSYVSANYTDALHVLVSRRPNVVAQLVAEEGESISLSSNTDISTDLFRMRDAGALDFVAVAEVHPQMPFLDGEGAIRPAGDFAVRLRPRDGYELFSAVKRPVERPAHAIGLHVAGLVADGGTLQIGIGAIGDAVAHALILRHRGEDGAIRVTCPFPVPSAATGPFDTGLHVVTEMLVGGLLALFEAGVVKREVDGIAVNAGFFVDTRDFYRRLREMPRDRRDRIAMRPVSFTNTLYGDEAGRRAARSGARFVNGAMKVSLLGDVMSDTVADGQVVSGVGGQFNFVEQAMALRDGRSIITVPATRMSGGRVESNIVWSVETTTVPRHMRDIVVSEYGIADLGGRSDAEVIAALIGIADSRFQEGLVARAKSAGKLPQDYVLPEAARQNTPVRLEAWLAPFAHRLPDFPLGTDFDDVERRLLPALATLRRESASWAGRARLLRDAVFRRGDVDAGAMRRMGFAPGTWRPAGLALKGALRREARSGPGPSAGS